MRLQCFNCGEIFKKEELSEEEKKELKCPKCNETKIIDLDENKKSFMELLKDRSLFILDKLTSTIAFILVEIVKFWIATQRTRNFILTEITIFLCLSLFILLLMTWFGFNWFWSGVFVLVFYYITRG